MSYVEKGRKWLEANYLRHDDQEDQKYGLPDLKKYPMPDVDHVKSAIRFFNYVDKKDEKELAKNILKRIKEYGIVLGEDITVGEDNRFIKYISKGEQNGQT